MRNELEFVQVPGLMRNEVELIDVLLHRFVPQALVGGHPQPSARRPRFLL